MLWLAIGGGIFGLFVGFGLAGMAQAAGRENYEPGIGHPGMTCIEARGRIEALQQDVLAMSEVMEQEQ